MKRSLALLALLIPILARADVVTSTNCSITVAGTTSSQTNPSSCSLIDPTGSGTGAIASISSAQTLPVLGSPSTPVSSSFTFDVDTGVPVSERAGYDASASASGTDSIVLYTTGPVRTGELAFHQDIGSDGIASSTSATISVGSLNTTCTVESFMLFPCTGNLGVGIVGNGTGAVPFTVGQSFLFSETVFQSTGGGGSIPHFGRGIADFSFTLLEADGTTPVQMYAIPEPATFVPAGLGLLAFLRLSRRARAGSR